MGQTQQQTVGVSTGATYHQAKLPNLSDSSLAEGVPSDLDTAEMVKLVALVYTTVMTGIQFISGLMKIFQKVRELLPELLKVSRTQEEKPPAQQDKL